MKTVPVQFLIDNFTLIDGQLFWKVRGHGRPLGRRAGAFTYGPGSHRHVMINGVGYQEHRVIFAMVHGRWPSDQIDHINLDKSDNRPGNLREATGCQNNANKPATRRNTSGAKGVSWSASRNKWCVSIKVQYRSIFLGRHDDLELAAFIYECAAFKYHGEFARVSVDNV